MDMLRHNHVAGHHEEIATTHALQRVFKEFHGCDRGQVIPAAIAAEGEEMEISGFLVTDAGTIHALRGYSNTNLLTVISATPRSPKARDRGHQST
jgi:hypothetical protein